MRRLLAHGWVRVPPRRLAARAGCRLDGRVPEVARPGPDGTPGHAAPDAAGPGEFRLGTVFRPGLRIRPIATDRRRPPGRVRAGAGPAGRRRAAARPPRGER